jgi:hypothetical protein
MKKVTLFSALLFLLLITLRGCDGCCEPDLTPTDKDRVHVQLGSGIWPSDYYPTIGIQFLPNASDMESFDISISQVQIVNGNPHPVGGSGTLNYDLAYLTHNNWYIDVWKNREYIVNIDIVQLCGLECNSSYWKQTATGDSSVSCYEPGNIKQGKSHWTYYEYVTVYPISEITVNPTFINCIDCGCNK